MQASLTPERWEQIQQLFDEVVDMAYYEGETLKRKIKQGPLPLDEALDNGFAGTRAGSGLGRARALSA